MLRRHIITTPNPVDQIPRLSTMCLRKPFLEATTFCIFRLYKMVAMNKKRRGSHRRIASVSFRTAAQKWFHIESTNKVGFYHCCHLMNFWSSAVRCIQLRMRFLKKNTTLSFLSTPLNLLKCTSMVCIPIQKKILYIRSHSFMDQSPIYICTRIYLKGMKGIPRQLQHWFNFFVYSQVNPIWRCPTRSNFLKMKIFWKSIVLWFVARAMTLQMGIY